MENLRRREVDQEMKLRFPFLLLLLLLLLLDVEAREPQQSPPGRSTLAQKIVRARDLGVPFDGTPGQLNAITDVVGVEVGYTTIIRGEGKLVVGKGPVRTGVTAVIPRGHDSLNDPVYAAVCTAWPTPADIGGVCRSWLRRGTVG